MRPRILTKSEETYVQQILNKYAQRMLPTIKDAGYRHCWAILYPQIFEGKQCNTIQIRFKQTKAFAPNRELWVCLHTADDFNIDYTFWNKELKDAFPRNLIDPILQKLVSEVSPLITI